MSVKGYSGTKSKNFGQQAGGVHSFRDQGVQAEGYSRSQMEQRRKCSQSQMEQMEQKTDSKKDDFPKIKDPKETKEVLLFIRGKKEFVQRLKNAFTKEKQIVQGYGGVYVGIADDIIRSEGDLYRGLPEACIAIIKFKDMENAERWKHSSPIFKQTDFPTPADEVEMFAIPMNYNTDADITAFQLTELYGLMVSSDEFKDNYVTPVVSKLNERKIYHGLLATPKVNRLRNCRLRPDTYILLHCAESLDKLKEFYDSSDYADYRDYRHRHVAENDTCFFSIKPIRS